jgi:hypothetical protein
MSRPPALTVSEERGVRTLHVGGEAIQSSMRLSEPFALELEYTRGMMSFLLFHPRPARALKIGLGGGSLVAPGALVLNLMNDDPKLDQRIARLEAAFGGTVLALPALYDPNVIVLALKGAPARIPWDALLRRAHALERRFALPLPRYVPRLKRMNRFDARALIIDPQGGDA